MCVCGGGGGGGGGGGRVLHTYLDTLVSRRSVLESYYLV